MGKLLTCKEVGAILRVDETTVRRYVKNGSMKAIELPHINERKQLRIKEETLQEILSPGSSSEEAAF